MVGVYSRLSRGGPCCLDSPAGEGGTVRPGSDLPGVGGAHWMIPTTASRSGPWSWVQPGWPEGVLTGVWGTHREAREALSAVSGWAVFPLWRADQVLSLGIAGLGMVPRGASSARKASPCPGLPCVSPDFGAGGAVPVGSTMSTRTTVTAAPVVPLDTEGTVACGGRTSPDTAPGTLTPHMYALPGRSPGLDPWLPRPQQPGTTPTQALGTTTHPFAHQPGVSGGSRGPWGPSGTLRRGGGGLGKLSGHPGSQQGRPRRTPPLCGKRRLS